MVIYRNCMSCNMSYKDTEMHECAAMSETARSHNMPLVWGWVCQRDESMRGYTYRRGEIAVTITDPELEEWGREQAVLWAFAAHLYSLAQSA